MNKRRIIFIAGLIAVFVGAPIVGVYLNSGPRYEGRSARAWARRLAVEDGKLSDTIAALQALGPAAVPHVSKLATYERSSFDAGYGRLLNNLPRKIASLLPAPKIDPINVRSRAVTVLGKLGPLESPAVETIALGLADAEPQVRSAAAMTLGNLRDCDPELVVMALTLSLHDPHLVVRQNASASLGKLGAVAELAVPSLRRLAEDDPEVRPFARMALNQIQQPAPPATSPLQSRQLLTTNSFHLGAGQPEWDEFAGKTPHGPRLDLSFSSKANNAEQTLFFRQHDVKHEWTVQLNGRKIGTLQLGEVDVLNALPVPPGALIDGNNTLSIIPPRQPDDIVVSDFRIEPVPIEQSLGESQLSVTVVDRDQKRPIPCRITVAGESGALVPIRPLPNQQLAVRPGVIYTGNGKAEFTLPSGSYVLYAGRGFEYGVSTQRVALARGDAKSIELSIGREVPTAGLVACDTHTHTLTYGGHGDSTIDERILTLAGEGIELPIATEHNRLVDYGDPGRKLNVSAYFTPVTGIEVTTRRGHFNVFPVLPDSRVPNHQIDHWPDLMQAIRQTPNVEVIILNHPRDLHSNFRPFSTTNFNPVTGQNLRGFDFEFNTLEIINSGALQSDLMLLYRDWFALLNHGYKIAGAAASDSHDVNRFILGQGRTYVAAKDDDPSKINVDEVSRSFREGRVSASMGLLTIMTVNQRFQPGDLVPASGDNEIAVQIRVLGPSWTTADRVELFANGSKIREQTITSSDTPSNSPEKINVTWKIPRPTQDQFLVAVASGPGVTAPYWPIPKPYQPSSTVWKPRVIGSTGVVWIDTDSDGKFTSAKAYAERLFALNRDGLTLEKLLAELKPFDAAVAAQAAALAQSIGLPLDEPALSQLLQRSAPAVRQGFEAFLQTRSN